MSDRAQRLAELEAEFSRPLSPLLRLWAGSGPIWWALGALFVACALLFALVIVVTHAVRRRQGIIVGICIAVMCVPIGWEWLWHALAPRLGFDLVDVLGGWTAHLVLAALIELLIVAPAAIAFVAESIPKERAEILKSLQDVHEHMAREIEKARQRERAIRKDLWLNCAGTIVGSFLVLCAILCGLGWLGEYLVEDPAGPPRFNLSAPREWIPVSPENVPIPPVNGRVVRLQHYPNHDRAYYWVALRKGERIELGEFDRGLDVTFQQRATSPFYHLEWTWEDAVTDAAFTAPWTGWFRIQVDAVRVRKGDAKAGGAMPWTLSQ